MGVASMQILATLPGLANGFMILTGYAGTGGVAGGMATGSGLTFGLASVAVAMLAIPIAVHTIAMGEATKAYDTFGGSVHGAYMKLVDLNEEMDRTTGKAGTRITTAKLSSEVQKDIDVLHQNLTSLGNGGGTNYAYYVNVTGNNYGVNSKDISNSLMDTLKSKIST
jgi:hypothetical protein